MLNRETIDKFVDVASVVLISVAAVLTALCGYQASRWDGEQTRLYNIANASRLHAAEAADRSAVKHLDQRNAVSRLHRCGAAR